VSLSFEAIDAHKDFVFIFYFYITAVVKKAMQRRSIDSEVAEDADAMLLNRGRRSTNMLGFLSIDGSSWSYGLALLAFLQQGNYASTFSSATLATAAAAADCKLLLTVFFN
jgi:hypothetical protein